MSLSLLHVNPALKASIPQAFRLHGILGKDADYATDSEDEDGDYSDYDDLSHDGFVEEESEEEFDSQDENQDDEKDDEPCAQDEHFVPFTKLDPQSVLLVHVKNHPEGVCSNSVLHQYLWMTDPKVDFSNPRRGFLSQLANICFQAKLRSCMHQDCLKVKDSMNNFAPSCHWKPFREWALTAMSCQASMDDTSKLSRAHTHIARAVSGCFKVLKSFLDRNESLESRFNFNHESPHVDLSEVVNLMYWMTRIQAELGTPPAEISDWDHHFLPFQYTIKSVQKAAHNVEKLGICKNRLWNLVNVSDRKHGDLPDIVTALNTSGRFLAHKHHEKCTPSKCQHAQMDSTKVKQLHKCNNSNCQQKKFPVELLVTNIEVGKSTAWICKLPKQKSSKAIPAKPQLNTRNIPYIAISHVWSDGTGVGVKDAGTVNTCLYEFFAGITAKLGCNSLWWDAISIPQEIKARNKALKTMHSNYVNAEYTVVHDTYLLNFPWKEDGSPCLAIVLSSWFTRGWTALELAMAQKVKVLFRDPDSDSEEPIIKDLDEDILAHSPQTSSRAHWLATCLIQRLRKPVEDVGDLIAVLAPRHTSWARDRSIIASLLAGVPDVDFTVGESDITRHVLGYLGKVPYFCLLHGKPTMAETGGYSWSPATLDDMPVEVAAGMQSIDDDTAGSMLEIDDKGSVWGVCACRPVKKSDVDSFNITAYGDNLAATVKVNLALADWETCLLVRPSAKSKDPRCLLVVPIGILEDGPTIKCRYIGTVLEGNRRLFRAKRNILIGGRDSNDHKPLDAWQALEELMDPDGLDVKFEDGEMVMEQDVHPVGDEITHEESWGDKEVAELGDQLEHLNLDESTSLEDFTPWSLYLALRSKNRSATRFLVSNDVTIDMEDFDDWLGNEDPGARGLPTRARALGLLGDVYMENGQVSNAIQAYKSALDGGDDKEADSEQSTTALQVQLSLGRAYLVSHHQLLHGQTQPTIEDDDNVERAKGLFSSIVSQGQKRGNYRTVTIQKPGDVGDLKQPKPKMGSDDNAPDPSRGLQRRATGAPGLRTANEVEETTRRDERRAIRFLCLELDAAAELIVMAISEFDFIEASKVYRLAIRHFGGVADDFVFEGFRPRWVERKTQKASDKEIRDNNAASIYHRALKRLSTLFKKNHLLILITSLQLGVNYQHRAELPHAATHLLSTLEGLTSHVESSRRRHENFGTQSAIGQNHPLIALTRYHLGEVFLEQERFKKAEPEFESALQIISARGIEARELRNVSRIALASCCLKHEVSNWKKGKEALDLVIADYEELSPTDDLHSRLAIEAQFLLAKAVYASIYEQGDQTNIVNTAVNICYAAMANTKNLATYKEGSDLAEERFLSFLSTLCEDLEYFAESQMHRKKSLEILKEVDGERSLLWLKGAISLVRISGKLRAKAKKDKPEELRESAESEQPLEKAECEDLLQRALKGFEEDLGEYSTKTLKTCSFIGKFYLHHNEMENAEKYCIRAAEGFEKALGSCRLTYKAAYTLGGIYNGNFKYTKAKEMLLKAYEGFKTEAAKQSNSIHTEFIQATMDLADCHASLGGPTNERTAIKYYEEAFKYLLDHGASESHNSHIVRLRQGNLYRQLKDFKMARSLIDEARFFFENPENSASGTETEREVARCEALLRLGELYLDYQRLDMEVHWASGEKLNPEDLINEAQEGLERALGEDDLLTLQATILRGEMCLDCKEPEHDHSEPEKYLLDALTACEKLLPPGTPTAIRIMDRLINYWAGAKHDQEEIERSQAMIEEVKRKKWAALTEGYGADTAVAIMKMTDLKRENLFSHDEVVPEEESDEEREEEEEIDEEIDEEFAEEHVADDEELTLWNQSPVQNLFAGQNQLQEQFGALLRIGIGPIAFQAGVGLQTNVVPAMAIPAMENRAVVDAYGPANYEGNDSNNYAGSVYEDGNSQPQGTMVQQQPAFTEVSPGPQMFDQRTMSPQYFIPPVVQDVAVLPQMAAQTVQNGMQQLVGQTQSVIGGLIPTTQAGFQVGFGFPQQQFAVQGQAGIGQQDAYYAQERQRGNQGQGNGMPDNGQQMYMGASGNVFGFGGQFGFGQGPF
ncbi:unnamed protein product [Fusarium graminearum]|uniref:Heterokaryon incompatibility domain-containing protein n=1 Tax=Gibberella zeae TaxID=5518 RepID=A0A9N8NIY4_GIBZA|nr:unnamed protein product [Fusarium graminearum]